MMEKPDSRLMEVPGLISVYNSGYGNQHLKPEAR
jgi:hypothetical protein